MWNGFRFGMGMMAGVLTTCLLLSGAVFMLTWLWSKIVPLQQAGWKKRRGQIAHVVPIRRRHAAALPDEYAWQALSGEVEHADRAATAGRTNREANAHHPTQMSS